MGSFDAYSTHTARKTYICEYCGSRIAPGSRYIKMAGVWEGDFYSGRGHIDCRQLWSDLYEDWSWDEGMLWDITEVFSETGEVEAAQEALNARRGFLPHAVNRIEFRMRNWLETEDTQ